MGSTLDEKTKKKKLKCKKTVVLTPASSSVAGTGGNRARENSDALLKTKSAVLSIKISGEVIPADVVI